ncbi:hypothetical protein OG255_45625 (plasmid) [Streptomyces sp. NBC_01455]|nr:hypothetical protein [Streptomyces sp. NBC_01455]
MGHADRVAETERPHPGTEFSSGVDLVPGEPAGPDPEPKRVGDHGDRLLRLRREHHFLRDTGHVAALLVPGPVPWQIQGPVDHHPHAVGDGGKVDGDLAQTDAPEGTGVLAAGPDAIGRGLRVPCLVGDQDHVLTCEFTHNETGDFLSCLLVVEPRTRQQVLQPVRARMTQRLGECPAVPRVQLCQQAADHLGGRRTRLPPSKAVRDHLHC